MTSSYQSQQEKAFRILGAPPDISKTNYLETEVDMVDAVNKQIDENQKDLERHYDQLINIWNHQYEKDARAPQKLLDLVKTGKQAYFDVKEFNEFNKRASKLQRGIEAVRNAKVLSTTDLLAWQKAIQHPDYKDGLKELGRYEAIQKARQLSAEYGDQASAEARRRGEAGVAHLIDKGPGNIHEFHFSNIKDKDGLKNHWPLMFMSGGAGLKVDVSHIYGQKPGTTLQTLANAKPGTYSYIYDSLLHYYLYQHSPIAYGTGDKIDRNLLEHFVKHKEVAQKNFLEAFGQADQTAKIEKLGELLTYELRDNPKILADWVNTYKHTFGGIGTAKAWQAEYVYKLGTSGKLGRDELETALNEPFEAHDSTPEHPHWVTVSDYWKPQAAKMRAGVTKYERDLMTSQLQDEQAWQFGIAEELISADNKGRKVPRTIRERNDLIQKWMQQTGVTDFTKVPDNLKNLSYAGQVNDQHWETQLARRELDGGAITEKDINFFEDPLLADKWRKKLKERGGSISADNRNDFVKAEVDRLLNHTLGDTNKTPEYVQVEKNLKGIYKRAFDAEYARSKDTALATTAAEDAVLAKVQDHIDGKIDLGERVRHTADVESIAQINKTREAIVKNPSLISSDKPWEGEAPHLQAAAKYFQGVKSGKRNLVIPAYYYNFKGIKKLPNGQPATPQNLMRYRLEATGILKNGEIKFIEDGLPITVQKQLANNTPSSVYRACQENVDQDWILNATSDPLAKANGGYDAIRHIDDDSETFRTDKLEKPLTQHTIGEVLGLMNQGYDNFGLYDISREGLIDILENSNAQLDDLFDKNNQDLIILGRLRQKSQANQKYSTLTQQYRRLVNIRPEDREQWLQIVGNLGPYSQLENLLPACATALVQETLQ